VLNASYEPLNVTTVRRAHVLVFKGKAEVIEELGQQLHSATDTYPWPHVIRLVAYVRVPRSVQRKISRRALFARDGWRCAYCGTTSGRLTLDHILPRSKGGESVWENVVTACAPCNHKKGDRTLEGARMELLHLPKAPAPVLFSRLSFERVLELWDDPARTEEPAYFGWLSNSLPNYPETLNLPASVVTAELELRPNIVLHDGEHPLVREQREGITVERLLELVGP